MIKHIRAYLVAGLLVWLPLWATFMLVRFLITILDDSLSLLPAKYQPIQILGLQIPGIGIFISILLLIVTGIFVTNIIGKKLLSFGESILDRIPLVRIIYKAIKQVVETVFSSKSESFRKVLLLEYPRKGIWSIALMMSEGVKDIDEKTKQEMVIAFVPTTPNPTSGFLIAVPKTDAIELEMSVDEALKMIISLGVIKPTKQNKSYDKKQ